MSMLKDVLVTGISGSGKSVALRMLEDASYTCVDNLPVRFLTEFIANARDEGLERVAVAIDVRSPGELAELPDVVTALRAMGTSLRVVFLDASTATLVQRYSESRRRHPLTDRLQHGGTAPSLTDCIALERELLAPLREQEHVIDTSDLTPGQLRAWIRDLIQALTARRWSSRSSPLPTSAACPAMPTWFLTCAACPTPTTTATSAP